MYNFTQLLVKKTTRNNKFVQIALRHINPAWMLMQEKAKKEPYVRSHVSCSFIHTFHLLSLLPSSLFSPPCLPLSPLHHPKAYISKYLYIYIHICDILPMSVYRGRPWQLYMEMNNSSVFFPQQHASNFICWSINCKFDCTPSECYWWRLLNSCPLFIAPSSLCPYTSFLCSAGNNVLATWVTRWRAIQMKVTSVCPHGFEKGVKLRNVILCTVCQYSLL